MANKHFLALLDGDVKALLMLFTCVVLSSSVNAVGNRTMHQVTDMAGRKVQIPDTINTYHAMSQIGIIYLYALNPDKLAGLVFPINEREAAWFPEHLHTLPVLGSSGKSSKPASIEQLALIQPDVILSFSTHSEQQVERADRLQQQTGIPVLCFSSKLEDIASVYRQLGEITGDNEQAERLASYSEQTLARVEKDLASISDADRRSVYYAEGPKGLLTDPEGSFHTSLFKRVKLRNVATMPVGSGKGRSSVSFEQVLMWDPDLIISGYDGVSGHDFFRKVSQSSSWNLLRAVKQQHIYAIPETPFDWFDRPPSVNRLLGLSWLSTLLYPTYVSVDLASEVRHFYQLFYHHALTTKELQDLLRYSMPADKQGNFS